MPWSMVVGMLISVSVSGYLIGAGVMAGNVREGGLVAELGRVRRTADQDGGFTR
jgi:hypothetical protein